MAFGKRQNKGKEEKKERKGKSLLKVVWEYQVWELERDNFQGIN